MFWLDREIISDALANILANQTEQDDARSRRIREIKEEGWDLFLRVLGDGSVVVTAVAVRKIPCYPLQREFDVLIQNIDRRPPTLLRQFTLQQSLPATLNSPPPSHLYLLANPGHSSITLVTSSPLTTFDLAPLTFFDAQSSGLRFTAKEIKRVPEEEADIVRLVRTPEGNGVGIIRTDGDGEAWRVVESGSKLVRSARWSSADHVVVLEGGMALSQSYIAP